MPVEIADRDIEETGARIDRNRMRIVPNIALHSLRTSRPDTAKTEMTPLSLAT
jgi:hypothetical protein